MPLNTMFEPPAELASDLEWMLQSGQVSNEMLLEAMGRTYYAPVYRLALSILDDRQAALQAVQDTFASALLDAINYREHFGVQSWLYAIALETCLNARKSLPVRRGLRKVLQRSSRSVEPGSPAPRDALDAGLWRELERLDDSSRLALLLRYVHLWSTEEIGQALDLTSAQLDKRLSETRQSLLRALTERQTWDVLHENLPDEKRFEWVLGRSLQRRWPEIQISDEELGEFVESVSRRTSKQGARRRVYSHAKEIIVTVFIILGTVVVLWGANTLWPETAPPPTRIATQLVFREVTATPQPTQDSRSFRGGGRRREPISPEAIYEVQAGDTLPGIVQRLGVSSRELQSLNRLPDNARFEVGQRLLIPEYFSFAPLPSTTPVPLQPQLTPLEEPFSTQDILSRLMQAPYHSLWIDVTVVDYGPPNYIGPPKINRVQAWLGEVEALILIGDNNPLPIEAWLHTRPVVYWTSPQETGGWFSEWRRDSTLVSETLGVQGQFFRGLFYSRTLAQGDILKGVGREIIAGRQALEVIQESPGVKLTARFWLDERTGLVLHHIQYEEGENKPLHEVVVNQIAYDVNFPEELFDPRLPWRGGFARDARGHPEPFTEMALEAPLERERISGINPPKDFDPSKAKLTFQYPDSDIYPYSVSSDIFGDGVWLGRIYMGDPWTMICQRSPDGKRVAFVGRPSRELSYESSLAWFSLLEDRENGLTALGRVSPMDGAAVTQFAFAPDSQRLAVFGYPYLNLPGTLFLVDPSKDEIHWLLSLDSARSLVWSPDGRYLALIARSHPNKSEDVIVMDVETEETIIYQPLEVGTRFSEEWPMADWGVEFPAEMGGLEQCAAPPEQ
jgi:RNA polymerase sigma-70 factor (ECF subfamily)